MRENLSFSFLYPLLFRSASNCHFLRSLSWYLEIREWPVCDHKKILYTSYRCCQIWLCLHSDLLSCRGNFIFKNVWKQKMDSQIFSKIYFSALDTVSRGGLPLQHPVRRRSQIWIPPLLIYQIIQHKCYSGHSTTFPRQPYPEESSWRDSLSSVGQERNSQDYLLKTWKFGSSDGSDF